jgi:hypothetical protein
MANELALTDRNKVDEMAERIAEFLPQSRSLPKDTRLAIAQIALAHRLDPFLGDIWAIPERNNVGGNWQTTGYRIMIGISAWRRAAQESGEYWGRHFKPATDEERQWLGAGPNDLAMRCIIYRRKTGQQPAEYDGFGIFKANEKSKMNPLQCVRLRAERDALKGAFPIGFGGGAVKIGVADDSGEEINGDIDHGQKWDVVTSGADDEETTPPYADEVVSTVPQPEPEAPSERKSYRMAHVKFNGMSTADWHERATSFAESNPNWLLKGTRQPDMNHILASAGHAGYEYITGDNVAQMFADIVAAHAAKSA